MSFAATVSSRRNRSARISCSISISPSASRARRDRSPMPPCSRSGPDRAASPARCWRSAPPASLRSSATIARSPRCRRSPRIIPAVSTSWLRTRSTFDPRPHFDRGPVRIVANLPYNIATALLVSWLTVEPWPPWYDSAVLMFQREVAQRIVAAHGSKATDDCRCWRNGAARRAFSSTSIRRPSCRRRRSHLRWCGWCRGRAGACDRKLLESVTQAAFGQRRKMLRQSLRSLGADVPALLAAAGLDPTARAEDISIEGFVALARALAAHRAHEA